MKVPILAFLVLVLSGCVLITPKEHFTFIIPNDFSGPIYLIGTARASGEFGKEIEVPIDGVIIGSSLEPFKGKRITDLKFKFRNGKALTPADANTYNDGTHVWNKALGSGRYKSGYVEFIIFFIGPRKEFNVIPVDIGDDQHIDSLIASHTGF